MNLVTLLDPGLREVSLTQKLREGGLEFTIEVESWVYGAGTLASVASYNSVSVVAGHIVSLLWWARFPDIFLFFWTFLNFFAK